MVQELTAVVVKTRTKGVRTFLQATLVVDPADSSLIVLDAGFDDATNGTEIDRFASNSYTHAVVMLGGRVLQNFHGKAES